MKHKSGYYKPDIPAEEKIQRERGFTLDCVAVGTLSTDRESFNPKLAAGIPPYNSQNDEALKNYFKKPVVKQTLSRTGQVFLSFFSLNKTRINACVNVYNLYKRL